MGGDMKAQGGEPPQGLMGVVLFFLSFFLSFIFCSLVDILHREEAGCEKWVNLQDNEPLARRGITDGSTSRRVSPAD